jgi:hypothetical protein
VRWSTIALAAAAGGSSSAVSSRARRLHESRNATSRCPSVPPSSALRARPRHRRPHGGRRALGTSIRRDREAGPRRRQADAGQRFLTMERGGPRPRRQGQRRTRSGLRGGPAVALASCLS